MNSKKFLVAGLVLPFWKAVVRCMLKSNQKLYQIKWYAGYDQ